MCTFQKRRCFERNNFVSVAQLHNILSHVFNTQSDNPSSLKLFLHDSSFPGPHLPVVVAHLPTLLSSNCFPTLDPALSDMQQALLHCGPFQPQEPTFMSGTTGVDHPWWPPIIGSAGQSLCVLGGRTRSFVHIHELGDGVLAKKRVIQFAAWVATPCAEPRPRKPSVIIMCPMFTIRLAIGTGCSRRAYHLPQRLRISSGGRLPTV